MLLPVIMAGGTGSRLWPLSRPLYPKQFLPLASKQSLLQDTLTRLDGLEYHPPIIICGEDHRFIVAEQLRQLEQNNGGIILEPEGRNTAPAIALAALHALAEHSDPTLLVLASDHLIQDKQTFQNTLNTAKPLTNDNFLVTFGIVASHPETGYGYIRRGNSLNNYAFEVDKFTEKPNAEAAQTYIDSGQYYWNSGLFMFKASQYLKELKQHRPSIYEACEKAYSSPSKDYDFIRINTEQFKKCPSDSIDYAVMENTDCAAVIPMDCGWNDLGSWSALYDHSPKDKNNNAISGDALTCDTHNSLIYSCSKLVTTLGINNIAVIETEDAILVADKQRDQDVKNIVNELQKQARPEAVNHRKVYRPWGYYDSIDSGHRFQVKRIVVQPGAQLSMQMHHHRAEHWIVVKGTAEVTKGDQTFVVSENQSTFIPIGTKHRLKNPGVIPLEIVEVQSGSYLGEDDIIRFEDNYGRHKNEK